MSNVSVWVAISSTGTAAIRERLEWDESTQGAYTGAVTDTEHKIFRRMQNFAQRERMFKKPTIAGKVWHLFELDFDATAKAQAAIDFIVANRPNHFVILGAWKWDGSQIAGYEPHAQLIKFMPDIITRDENGDIISTDPATVLTDVHLIQGQSPRVFT